MNLIADLTEKLKPHIASAETRIDAFQHLLFTRLDIIIQALLSDVPEERWRTHLNPAATTSNVFLIDIPLGEEWEIEAVVVLSGDPGVEFVIHEGSEGIKSPYFAIQSDSAGSLGIEAVTKGGLGIFVPGGTTLCYTTTQTAPTNIYVQMRKHARPEKGRRGIGGQIEVAVNSDGDVHNGPVLSGMPAFPPMNPRFKFR